MTSKADGIRPALAALVIALITPLVYVTSQGLTFTGIYEESIGYRYFYSLRYLYEPEQFLFLPQGQLVTLIHQVLQFILNWYLPYDQLLPRIDIFARLAVFIAHGATVIAFAWAVAPKAFDKTRIAMAIVWALLYYGSGWNGALVILSPDYHAWIPTFALLFLGLTVRIFEEPRPLPAKRYLQLAIIGGLSLSLKLSMGVFIVVICLFVLIYEQSRFRNLYLMAAMCVICVICAALVFLLCFGGHWEHLQTHYEKMQMFLESATKEHPLSRELLLQTARASAQWEALIILALPAILLLFIFAARNVALKAFLVSASMGSIVYAYFTYLRFTQITLFESAAFMLYALSVLIAQMSFGQQVIRRAITIGLIVLLAQSGFGLFGSWRAPGVLANIRGMAATTVAQEELHRLINPSTEPVAFLIPENKDRLFTLDTALYKGATGVFDKEIRGKLMRSMMINRAYFVGPQSTLAEKRPNVLDFDKMVFTLAQATDRRKTADYYHREIPERISELEGYYGVSLKAFACARWIDFEASSGPTAVVCRQETVPAAQIKDSTLPWDASGKGYWFPYKEPLRLRIGTLIAENSNGVRARVAGRIGDKIILSGVGSWNYKEQKYKGLVTRLDADGWYIDMAQWLPANQNFGLKGASKSGIPEFWISPAEAMGEVRLIQGESGSKVRITALAEAPYMVVNGRLPSVEDRGGPVSVIAIVRVPSRREVVFTIHDVVDKNGQSESSVVVGKPEAGGWVAGVVRKENTRYPNSGDNFGVGIGKVKAGDYFDLQFVGAYNGIAP